MNYKIGTPFIFDADNQTSIHLPLGYLIFNRNDRIWMGGSTDGSIYVHIERMKGPQPIPTILAEGDLDLFIASVGKEEALTPNISRIKVGGSQRSNEITGYLATIKVGNARYLVLTSCKASQSEIMIDQASRNLLAQMEFIRETKRTIRPNSAAA